MHIKVRIFFACISMYLFIPIITLMSQGTSVYVGTLRKNSSPKRHVIIIKSLLVNFLNMFKAK
jgi:hypothetical protein